MSEIDFPSSLTTVIVRNTKFPYSLLRFSLHSSVSISTFGKDSEQGGFNVGSNKVGI